MRIVTGKYKGRTLLSPDWETTRPMTDKVRGAVFNILGDVGDARVLDLYAGTGAVGLEALSRGAREAWFVDADRRCAELIRRNGEKTGGLPHMRVLNDKVERFLQTSPASGFDLVFFTPPYALFDFGLLAQVSPFLNPDATVVAEKDVYRDPDIPPVGGLSLWERRQYGGTEVLFYVRV